MNDSNIGTSTSRAAPTPRRRSRFTVVLLAVWFGLAVLLGRAFARGESVRTDYAMSTVVFVVVSALLASRVWSRLQK